MTEAREDHYWDDDWEPHRRFALNAGYHNEHHDFPGIPGRRLPLLRNMAREYYDDLQSYDSWIGVILKFLTPEVTLYSRTKRRPVANPPV